VQVGKELRHGYAVAICVQVSQAGQVVGPEWCGVS
jgi:hypothetical protein